MLINPTIAIAEKWITHPNCLTEEDWHERKFVSPNAIDFTIDHMYTINENNTFIISEDGKQMRKGTQHHPVPWRRGGNDLSFWNIQPHTVVDFMSDMYVELPKGVAATLIIRSTFNRNGLFLTSGLYDSGFCGNVAGTLHNRSGHAKVAPGTRLGQICFWRSDSAGIYAGGYNTENGQHWLENQGRENEE